MPLARMALHNFGEQIHVAVWPTVHELHQLASRHCLHFTSYIWLDKLFDMAEMWKDVAKRPYITLGFHPLTYAAIIAMFLLWRFGDKLWPRPETAPALPPIHGRRAGSGDVFS